MGSFWGKYALGFQISNVGDKIRYEKLAQASFIPTNLKIGGGYFLETDSYNTFSFLSEINKLLVPFPLPDQSGVGKLPKVDFFSGIFHSFSDAPNGFSEELQEISWALGFEYTYNEALFLRTGYFYQHKNKGDRKYLTIGTGFKLNSFFLDFSYLFSTAKTHNPLSSSLRISLLFGATSIILGAFGAHSLKKHLAEESLSSFEIGVRYQMYHALFLLFLASTEGISDKLKKTTFILTVLGVLFFSGSIYLLSTKSITSIDISSSG